MSFGWLGIFREGQWRDLRRFLLEQRRDVASRVSTLEYEITRIGDITPAFAIVDGKATEDRVGLFVTPNTTLSKLVEAYVVQGGNPLDISLFLKPGRTVVVDDEEINPYPFGGVLSPQQDDHSPHRKSKAGMLPNRQYLPNRLPDGRSCLSHVTNSMGDHQQLLRRVFTREIGRLRELEERILKLCDLREQLEYELQNVLVAAFGGTLNSLPRLDAQFAPGHLVTALVAEIDRLVWIAQEGRVDLVTNNDEALAENPNIVMDLPGEEWSAL